MGTFDTVVCQNFDGFISFIALDPNCHLHSRFIVDCVRESLQNNIHIIRGLNSDFREKIGI